MLISKVPPGPPPRPGLQWNEFTHRWIRPRREGPGRRRSPKLDVSTRRRRKVEDFSDLGCRRVDLPNGYTMTVCTVVIRPMSTKMRTGLKMYLRNASGELVGPSGTVYTSMMKLVEDVRKVSRADAVLTKRVRRDPNTPPGPPPRPGLVWFGPTQRWRRPKGEKGEQKYYPHVRGPKVDVVEWIAPVIETTDSGAEVRKTASGQVIPKTWTHVAINADAEGDFQAIGKDGKGNTVRLMSEGFTKSRSVVKYAKQKDFEKGLPAIRSALKRDFDSRDEAKVLHLIDLTGFRIGDYRKESAEEHMGIVNLRMDNVQVRGNKVTFDFIGKAGVRNSKTVSSSKLANYVKFRKGMYSGDQYLFDTTDVRVRHYMEREPSMVGYSPKDFRTHHATNMAKKLIKDLPVPGSDREYKRQRLAVAKQVSAWLHNTPGVALGSYISPDVFKLWDKALQKDLIDWRRMWRRLYDYDYEELSDGSLVLVGKPTEE